MRSEGCDACAPAEEPRTQPLSDCRSGHRRSPPRGLLVRVCLLNQTNSPRAGQTPREELLEPTFTHRAAPARQGQVPGRWLEAASRLPLCGEQETLSPRPGGSRSGMICMTFGSVNLEIMTLAATVRVQSREWGPRWVSAAGVISSEQRPSGVLEGVARFHLLCRDCLALALWGVKLKSSSPLRHCKDISQEGLLVRGVGWRHRASA